jgi:hypothetical protein
MLKKWRSWGGRVESEINTIDVVAFETLRLEGTKEHKGSSAWSGLVKKVSG